MRIGIIRRFLGCINDIVQIFDIFNRNKQRHDFGHGCRVHAVICTSCRHDFTGLLIDQNGIKACRIILKGINRCAVFHGFIAGFEFYFADLNHAVNNRIRIRIRMILIVIVFNKSRQRVRPAAVICRFYLCQLSGIGGISVTVPGNTLPRIGTGIVQRHNFLHSLIATRFLFKRTFFLHLGRNACCKNNHECNNQNCRYEKKEGPDNYPFSSFPLSSFYFSSLYSGSSLPASFLGFEVKFII